MNFRGGGEKFVPWIFLREKEPLEKGFCRRFTFFFFYLETTSICLECHVKRASTNY